MFSRTYVFSSLWKHTKKSQCSIKRIGNDGSTDPSGLMLSVLQSLELFCPSPKEVNNTSYQKTMKYAETDRIQERICSSHEKLRPHSRNIYFKRWIFPKSQLSWLLWGFFFKYLETKSKDRTYGLKRGLQILGVFISRSNIESHIPTILRVCWVSFQLAQKFPWP